MKNVYINNILRPDLAITYYKRLQKCHTVLYTYVQWLLQLKYTYGSVFRNFQTHHRYKGSP